MANPQLENGYTAIANELLEALCRHAPGRAEGRVFDYIMRQTYGWNKKLDRLSYSQIQEGTGLSRRAVIYAMENLEAKNMITVGRAKVGDQLNLVGVQKDYENWRPDAVSPRYQQLLDHKKQRYHAKLVAPVQTSTNPAKEIVAPVQTSTPTSANNVILPVQTSTKNSGLFAPTKERKTLQKHITKAKTSLKQSKQSFEEYRDSLKPEYPDVDYEHELKKFWMYWDGHDKKHTPQNLKLCLINWMDRAQRWDRNGAGNGRKQASTAPVEGATIEQ